MRMLLRVATHAEYLAARERLRASLSPSDLRRLSSGRLASGWVKLGMLDLDPAASLLLSLYSQTAGRPARDPTAYIRSFVLMLHLGFTSVQRWVERARSDALIRCLLGVADDVPAVSCHYDFINRVTGDDPHMGELFPARKNSREVKAELRAQGAKRGDKWVNWDEGDTLALKLRYWDGAACDSDRWTIALERLLDLCAVRPSCERYGIGCDNTLSGDGSALHIHSSPHGRKVSDPPDDAHTHRYSAPDADMGWDSDKEAAYLGYTFYNISWHSRELGIDLPVFAAQRAASQHDALTAITATAHMLDVSPHLRPKYFCHDSAADAAHLFELMRHWGIVPIIDWNPRHASRENPYEAHRPNGGPRDDDGRPLERLDEHGVPVCAAGIRMVRDGYDSTKMATKYRCPCAKGRIASCDWWGKCTESPYGRVVKTYDRTDYKLFGPVPYKSDRWRDIYRDRTCTERVNNRVLNDYRVQSLTCRNGPKHFLFEVMACINIHLDAWTKTAA